MRSLVRLVSVTVFPVLLVALLIGIVLWMFHGGSSGSPSEAGQPTDIAAYVSPTPALDSVDTADYPKGYPVVFSDIADDGGERYPPAVAEPSEVYAVTNPVTVWLAIGAGLTFAREDEPPQINRGHLHVLIDAPLPGPEETIPDDDTHIDLGDASHVLTLPRLSPGDHRISAVWTSSSNETGPLVEYSTVKLNVASDLASATGETPAASESPADAALNCFSSATVESYQSTTGLVAVAGAISCLAGSPDVTAMHATWRDGRSAVTCDGTPSADPNESCTLDVSDAGVGEYVQIEVSFTVATAHSTLAYSAATGFAAQ